MPVSQYIRAFSLIVADDTGKGIDLSEFGVKFIVHHGTFSFPHTCDVRIYNLSQETQNRIGTEFMKMKLLAGYEGNFGVIFQGAIKQVRKGRESATDTYTDIRAADGDHVHNFGVLKTTLPAGYTQQQVWQTMASAVAPYNETENLQFPVSQNPAPRGKVLYGAWRDHIRNFANTNDMTVTVDASTIKALPLLAYKQTDTIDINVRTGMVGVPEQTEQGITVTCLLNPAITWGSPIRINNRDIAQNVIGNEPVGQNRLGETVIVGAKQAPIPFPDLSRDGLYKALAVDHVGETRGEPWYTQIICLALDPSQGGFVRTPLTVNVSVGEPKRPE